MRMILTFPIARKPLSNSMMIPRNEKRTPNPVKPSPISVGTVGAKVQKCRCIVQDKQGKCHQVKLQKHFNQI
jgi:hypothetical protein